MKERNIKKAYNEIKISNIEKEKIFNSVINKRKKKNNWKLTFSISTVAFASFIFFMIYIFNSNPINEGRNIVLENSFSRSIIVGAKEYLSAKNIDVNQIKNGENLVIDAKDIVDSEEYSLCKGNLIITRYNSDFSYSTSVKCSGYDTNIDNKKEYIVYDGYIQNVFEVDKYIAITSAINTNRDNMNITIDQDINITLFDENGKVIFNKLVESVYKDEDSMVELKSINKLNDKYYITLNMTSDAKYNSSGAGSHMINHYLLVLDKNGKEISKKQLITEDNRRIYILSSEGYSLMQFNSGASIGQSADAIYYTGMIENDGNVILKLSENGFSYIPYEVVKFEPIFVNYILTDYYKDNFYGYRRNIGEGNMDFPPTVFKLDVDGSKIWEKEIDALEYISNIEIFDNSIYVFSHSDSKEYIYKFDLDGNRLSKVSVDVNEHFYCSRNHQYLDKHIIMECNNVYSTNITSFKVLNDKLEFIDEIKYNSNNIFDINSDFELKYMTYWKLKKDNKFNFVYSANNKLNNNFIASSVLLIYEQ